MSAAKTTVAILYGLGEGPRISRKLRALLQQEGFECITDPDKADVLLAHSGGILTIPAETTDKTILMVAPITGWRGPLIPTQVRKVKQDYRAAAAEKRLRHWLFKSLLNTGYLVKNAATYRKLWQIAHDQRHILPALRQCRVGVLAFRNDPWSGYLGSYGFQDQLPYTFVNFDRLHDDLWNNPHDYIRILRYLHTQAALEQL